MIRRVRIKGYKSFVDAELSLEPLTCLCGANGSGKSNTFDALGLLQALVLTPSLPDAIKSHRGTPLEAFRLPPGGMAALLEERAATLTLEADVRLPQDVMETVDEQIRDLREGASARRRVVERFLRYSVTVELEIATGHVAVLEEDLVAIRRDGTLRPGREPFLVRRRDEGGLRMEGQDHEVRSWRRGAGTTAAAPFYPPHHPHTAALREEVLRWSFHHLDPQRLAEDAPLREQKRPGPRGEGLAACLHTLKSRQREAFDALNTGLSRLVPGVEGVDTELNPAAGLLQMVVRESGQVLPARLASAGTLRVAGLLAVLAAAEAGALVGLEEPENGVHPSRLEDLTAILRGHTGLNRGQIVINTHSPILAELFSSDHLVLCVKKRNTTTFTAVQNIAPLFRRQEIKHALEPIEDDAASRQPSRNR